MKKVVIIICLIFVMLAVPVYAAGEGQPEAITYKVYDLAGLLNAVEKAADDDIIELQNPITISESAIIGSANKHIIIHLKKQYSDTSRPIFYNYNYEVRIELRNITFDCQNIQSGPVLSSFGCEVLIDGCVFQNISSSSDYVIFRANMMSEPESTTVISNSLFQSIRVDGFPIKIARDCNVVISNCAFEDMFKGYHPLIYNEGTISLLETNIFPENTITNHVATVDNRGTLYLGVDMSDYAEYYGYAPLGWYRASEGGNVAIDMTQAITQTEVNEACYVAFITDKEFPPEEADEGGDEPEVPDDPPHIEEPEEDQETVVSDFSSLAAAIKAAQDGDTILLSGSLLVSESVVICDEEKTVYLMQQGETSELPSSNARIVEVEKIVEIPIPVEVEKIVEVEKPVEVEKIVEVPVTVEIEKIIEVPVEVEKIVEVPVEVERIVPVEVEKIVEVEKLVEVEPPKETVELNGVALERNDDYLSGYFSALKGEKATRADVAQILYHLIEHDGTSAAADYGYIDVPLSAPYADAVNALSNAGLFCGCGNGLFSPDDTMTKAQVLVVLDRLLDLEPVGDADRHWSMPYLRAAQACGFAGKMTVQELGEAISMVELQEMIDYLFAGVHP